MEAKLAKELSKEKGSILDRKYEIDRQISFKEREIIKLKAEKITLDKKLSDLIKLDNITINEQFDSIIKNIEDTCKNGMTTYYYSEYLLHKENRIRLGELGYRIKDIDNIISISW
jgi:hypothetical protein